MLPQQKADQLIHIPKLLVNSTAIQFPIAGDSIQLEAKSEDGRDTFMFDVNRKGRIRLSRCTYQERYAVIEILLRLDVDGPPHENPDGTEVPCPHLHVYREEYGDKWAYPVPPGFTNTTDLVRTLQDFLGYCRVDIMPPIQRSVN